MKKLFLAIILVLAASLSFAVNTPNNTKMLTDAQGALLPQYWDDVALVWRAISATYPMPNAAPAVSVSVTSNDITKFGGANVSTGTGVGGVGIPRVTVSSDSTHPVTQSGTWTVQPGNTVNTTPWLMTLQKDGVSAAVTVANALKVDGSATIQPVSLSASATGAYSFTHVATSTDTVVKAIAGTLHGVTVNAKGTVASAVTIYNNTTCDGDVIAVIDSLNLTGLFLYDVDASVGICITTTGTVAPDITAIYK